MSRIFAIWMISLTGACTPQVYHTRADRETYSVLYEKTAAVENVDHENVDIALPGEIDISGLRSSGVRAEYLGPISHRERKAKVMTLPDALETGVTHGRNYLTQKERVFLSALELTLVRYDLAPISFARGSLDWATDSRTATLQQGMTELVSTNTFARNSSIGFNWLLKTGARVSSDFTRDFLRFTTGNRSLNSSDLAVSLIQPLLQGGGTTVTLEALTQEERNVLYDLRDFADFRRFYVVDVVSSYYAVLEARDRAQNNYVAYKGFLGSVEREKALVEEERSTLTQLGQLQQAALRAESRWVNAVRSYETQLDNFKILIGLPVEENVILEASELEGLRIVEPGISREEAVRVALVTRPDLATSRDLVEDAERQIKVTKNGLLPGLDVSLDYNSLSNPRDTTPGVNFDRRRWRGTLDLDLPLDRKAERNNYRAAQIFLDRAERSLSLAEDEARLEIFDAWRDLDQARLNHKIAEQGVSLADRRLEEQLLLAELGGGRARDLVEAQEDLVDAQNQRTASLVDHALARMRLWRDMGILYVSEDGSWITRLENEGR
ncbi:MAG: TolC family protein [Verrucomicrobiota bacterium]